MALQCIPLCIVQWAQFCQPFQIWCSKKCHVFVCVQFDELSTYQRTHSRVHSYYNLLQTLETDHRPIRTYVIAFTVEWLIRGIHFSKNDEKKIRNRRFGWWLYHFVIDLHFFTEHKLTIETCIEIEQRIFQLSGFSCSISCRLPI